VVSLAGVSQKRTTHKRQDPENSLQLVPEQQEQQQRHFRRLKERELLIEHTPIIIAS
jgi:hypothetical protein